MLTRTWLAAILLVLPLSADTQELYSRGIKILRSQANRRIAICIGINHYNERNLNPLTKAANDAYGLASVLEQKGDFKTYVFSDLDRDGKEKTVSARMLPTKQQLEEFFANTASFGDIKPDDLVVFSFSGHGISDAQNNGYLLPLDWNGAEPYKSAIPVSAVTGWLQKIGVTKSLVLIDACREKMSASRSLDTMPRLYEEKFLTANLTAVFYATKQDGFSYEDPESNYGAFTRFLINGLDGSANRDSDEVVTFRELSTYVEDNIRDWALKNGYSQRPYTRIFGEQSGDLALSIASPGPAIQRDQPLVVPTTPGVSSISGIRMVSIPGGTFQMGSNNGQNDEKPVHTVTVSAFDMSVTEITVGQFRAFVNGTGYQTEAERGDGANVFENGDSVKRQDANWKNPYMEQGDNHPVTCVSWNDAKAYCDWLQSKTGGVVRLPTEAEWEYACRAGTTTEYYTGDSKNLARAGWYYGNSGDRSLVAVKWDIKTISAARCRTHPVGQKTPNAFGLYDMHGNVWERCSDFYGSYSNESVKDPTGAQAGSARVVRGGSWFYYAIGCRSAVRDGTNPDSRSDGRGFRVVRRP